MTTPESPYGPSTIAPSPAPIPAAQPNRGLGIASLVLSLIPQAVLLIFIVIIVVAASTDDTGWAILGWAILSAYSYAILTFLLGGTAVGIGIAAIVKNRGRNPGIAGTVIGGLTLLVVLVGLAQIPAGALL
jgi:hypothetical protein